ncbi:Ubiquitinyl hydrolase 1 [Handroanthus impetiginosus]|uniref:Ubiquitin carboxyl-terminal hydrolase n=1 Tax=Handroanthus impetiginosus TaxID=429701 RepID=A0A2G9H7N4_9LAMI|nr:Ubiquitinyl hydrolase 1 [Handroanthus impetiginosus]
MANSRAPKTWLPLEANPDVMNQFIWGLGVAPDEAECFDVYGLDEELLEMVPKPVLAVLFLFPLTPESEQERSQQDEEIKVSSTLISYLECCYWDHCFLFLILRWPSRPLSFYRCS